MTSPRILHRGIIEAPGNAATSQARCVPIGDCAPESAPCHRPQRRHGCQQKKEQSPPWRAHDWHRSGFFHDEDTSWLEKQIGVRSKKKRGAHPVDAPLSIPVQQEGPSTGRQTIRRWRQWLPSTPLLRSVYRTCAPTYSPRRHPPAHLPSGPSRPNPRRSR